MINEMHKHRPPYKKHSYKHREMGTGLSDLEKRQKYRDEDFVFKFYGSDVVSTGLGGELREVNVENFAPLEGLGVSSIKLDLAPCSMGTPHLHPRANELLHVLKGKFLVGFLEENNGRYIENNITVGYVTVFPQGLVHFEINLECTPATFLSAFSSEDPGTLTIANRLFDINQLALTSTFNTTNELIDALRIRIPTNPALLVGECRKRCGL